LKVLLVTSEFPPQPGGIGHHACNLAKYLNREGIETTILCESRSAATFSEELDYDAKLPFQVFRASRKSNTLSRYFQRIRELLKLSGAPAQTIIASGYWPLMIVGAAKFLGLRKQPTIYVAHALDVNPSNPLLKKVCHFLLARFGLLISVSAFTKQVLPEFLQIKTKVILNGFDRERFDLEQPESAPLEGLPSLITLGSLTARKGQVNVVKALPEILKKFPEAHYHIIGIPVEKESLLSLATQLDVVSRVHIYGALEDEMMIRKLKGADVFMMLSNHTPDGDFEGFGIAILEAGYMGVPAVGSKGSGIEDAIEDRVSGYLVNPLQPKEVADAIEDIMKKEAYYRHGSQKHAESYTWDSVVLAYIKALQLLNEGIAK